MRNNTSGYRGKAFGEPKTGARSNSSKRAFFGGKPKSAIEEQPSFANLLFAEKPAAGWLKGASP